MTTNAHPIELAAIAAVGLARVARTVLVPCLALVLVLAGWHPSRPALAAQPAPAPVAVAAVAPAPVALVAPLSADRMDYLTVAELRRVARAAGHRALARNGRRADLLAVLAA